MNRRGLVGGGIASLVGALSGAVARSEEVAIPPFEVIEGDTGSSWVAFGDRWALIEDQNGQPTIGWTGRYDDAGEWHWDEFVTYLPGYVATELEAA